MENLDSVIFLIPSLDPDERIVSYVSGLIDKGAMHILLIDDGSCKDKKVYFDTLSKNKEVTVLRHAVNQGKGRSLKTGFNYVLNVMPEMGGVVSADCDGQHSTQDTIKVAEKMLETNQIVFGTRNFDDQSVPFNSKKGNKITTFVFKLLYGRLVDDTQTGLRAIPIDYVPTCLKLQGERFEYEIRELISIVKDDREIISVPIETIYDSKENHQTHFNQLKDSIRIYKVMLEQFISFTFSSLLSSIVDLGLFTVLRLITASIEYSVSIFLSTVLARIVSSLVNYLINKKSVFKSNDKKSLIKYYILVIVQMLVSSVLVTILFSKLQFNTSVLKIIVDVLLFFISYRIQKEIVFK